ncbi:hypothetical protein JL721_898 [Aureococcus anophagefferens]|nr:hypothetical protein JL721_898 [Aureococcus anophagefferens]
MALPRALLWSLVATRAGANDAFFESQSGACGTVVTWSSYHNRWSNVCDDSWGVDDATVFCRDAFGANYVASSAPCCSPYGAGSYGILLRRRRVRAGTEDDLDACTHSTSHNCGSSEYAGACCEAVGPTASPTASPPGTFTATSSCASSAGCGATVTVPLAGVDLFASATQRATVSATVRGDLEISDEYVDVAVASASATRCYGGLADCDATWADCVDGVDVLAGVVASGSLSLVRRGAAVNYCDAYVEPEFHGDPGAWTFGDAVSVEASLRSDSGDTLPGARTWDVSLWRSPATFVALVADGEVSPSDGVLAASYVVPASLEAASDYALRAKEYATGAECEGALFAIAATWPPTAAPTASPTSAPSRAPAPATRAPTAAPTASPTSAPSAPGLVVADVEDPCVATTPSPVAATPRPTFGGWEGDLLESCAKEYGVERCYASSSTWISPIGYVDYDGRMVLRKAGDLEYWALDDQWTHCQSLFADSAGEKKSEMRTRVMENVRGHLKTGLAKTHEIVCSSASGLTFAGAILVGFEAVTLHETMCFSQKTFEVRCPSLTARAFTLGLGMRLAGTVDPQTYWTSWEDLYGTDDTYPLDFAYACTPSLHLTPIVALTDWTRYCDIYWGGLRVGAMHQPFSLGLAIFAQVFSAGSLKLRDNYAVQAVYDQPSPHPTPSPTPRPSPAPTPSPSPAPTVSPTTGAPTLLGYTHPPTGTPTTAVPTTARPTATPTRDPTPKPTTSAPSPAPSAFPTSWCHFDEPALVRDGAGLQFIKLDVDAAEVTKVAWDISLDVEPSERYAIRMVDASDGALFVDSALFEIVGGAAAAASSSSGGGGGADLVEIVCFAVAAVAITAFTKYVERIQVDVTRDDGNVNYIAIALAMFDFFSDMQFAWTAFASERTAVSYIGLAMLVWVLVVMGANTLVLRSVKGRYPLDQIHMQKHPNAYALLHVVTATSTELLSIFPWRGPLGEGASAGFPDGPCIDAVEYSGMFEDVPQFVLQICVFVLGSNDDLDPTLVACAVFTVTNMIARVMMKSSQRGSAGLLQRAASADAAKAANANAKAAAKAPALAPAPAPREKFAVGAKVKAKFNAHKGCTAYYAGKIATDHGDGTYDVDYDDGDAEQKVPADLIVRWSSSS